LKGLGKGTLIIFMGSKTLLEFNARRGDWHYKMMPKEKKAASQAQFVTVALTTGALFIKVSLIMQQVTSTHVEHVE
jgi:hypothetical protein